MKAFLFVLVLLISSAFAGEVIVMDVPAKGTVKSDNLAAKFLINEEAGSGAVVLTATRSERDCDYTGDAPRCTTSYWNILTQTAEVEGLKVVDKIVTFEDRVNCGKMGVSRIFKVPTFYMSGNCTLDVSRVNVSGEKRILVRLVTKD